MGYAVGLDVGTTFTAAAVARGDERPEVVQLGVRAAAIPSVVFLHEASVLTGDTAVRRGLSEPDRLAREFKRRVGDPAPILLGGVPISAETLFARVLRSTVGIVAEREGGLPDRVAVCHPANWGPYKLELLAQACRIAELEGVVTISEPEAAAIQYAAQERVEPGALVAVYDLGGGTFDAAVLRKSEEGFEILGAPEGIERLGGIDFDEAVVAHVRAAIGNTLAELDLEEPRTVVALARLRQECVEAKEALSADVETSIPVVLRGLETEVRLTRAEFESMIRVPLLETIAALRRALRSAAVEPEELSAVLLVGGSSRIPMVAEMVGAELGRPVAVDADPKYVVALGAARAAAARLEQVSVPLAVAPAPAVENVQEEEGETEPAIAAGVVFAEGETATQPAIAAAPLEESAPATALTRPQRRPAPPPATAPPPPGRPPKQRRPRRTLIVIAAAALLAAAAGAIAVVLATRGGGNEGGPAPAVAATTQVTEGREAATIQPAEPEATPAGASDLELVWTRLEDASLAGPGRQEIDRVAAGPDGTLVAVGSERTGSGGDAAFWTVGDLEGAPSVEKRVSAEPGDQVPFGVSAGGAGSFVAVGFRQPEPGSPDVDAAVWLSSRGSWELVPGDFGDPPYQLMNRVAANAGGELLAVGAVAAGTSSTGAPLQTDAAAWLSTDGGGSFDRLEEATVAKDAYQVMRAATAYDGGWAVVGEDGPDAAVWRFHNGAWRQVDTSPDLSAGERWVELDVRDVHGWLGGLVAVGFVTSADGDRDAGVWTSPDGESWRLLVDDEELGGPGDQEALGVVAGEFGIVAVGCSRCEGDDTQPVVWTSADGEAWTTTAGDELFGAGTAGQLSAVTVAGPILVAAGWEGAGAARDAAVWLGALPATA